MDKQQGFSLIEVLISLLIAGAFSLALLQQLLNSKLELNHFLQSANSWEFIDCFRGY